MFVFSITHRFVSVARCRFAVFLPSKGNAAWRGSEATKQTKRQTRLHIHMLLFVFICLQFQRENTRKQQTLSPHRRRHCAHPLDSDWATANQRQQSPTLTFIEALRRDCGNTVIGVYVWSCRRLRCHFFAHNLASLRAFFD